MLNLWREPLVLSAAAGEEWILDPCGGGEGPLLEIGAAAAL